MKFVFPVLFFLLAANNVRAQAVHHRILFDFVSSDTADQSAIIRQFNNVLNASPDAELELVCHGPAVFAFVKDKMNFEDRFRALTQKGKVYYRVCANSMKRLGIVKEQLSPLVEVVPVAILEMSDKQQQGWAYIKSGH